MKSYKTTIFAVFTVIASTVILGGCSILPYENQYSCRLKDNYGKCISSSKAYEESVTGVSQGPAMKPHSEQKKDKKSDKKGQNHDSGSPQPQTAETAYDEYKERTYRELAGLVDQGHTPMLKPATTIRTLILPYSPRNQGESIFMPRFVYSVYDQPKWVLGEYLYRDPSIFKGLVDGKGYSK